MTRFEVGVPLRWSDQDAFGHVNHARTVTLIEDARVAALFDSAGCFRDGLLVAQLHVDYQLPIPYGPDPVQVELWVDEVRAVSFMMHYLVHCGPSTNHPVAASARTKMVPYELAAARPRRITSAERAFLDGLVDHQ